MIISSYYDISTPRPIWRRSSACARQTVRATAAMTTRPITTTTTLMTTLPPTPTATPLAHHLAITLKAKLFRGFSDPSRLSILDALRHGPRTVGELMEATGLGQSNTSNHLACLRDCGLVSRTRRGRHAVYELSDARIAEILSGAELILADAARGVYECTRYGGPPAPPRPAPAGAMDDG